MGFFDALSRGLERSREALNEATGVWEAVGREGAKLEGRGRVLVRPSGTEPLVRVMVEAPTEQMARSHAENLAAKVRERLSL